MVKNKQKKRKHQEAPESKLSFSDTSSLDLSIQDFDLDDESETTPPPIIIKKKHKRRRFRRRRIRRRMQLAITSEQFHISEEPFSEPPISTATTTTPTSATTSALPPSPVIGPASFLLEDDSDAVEEEHSPHREVIIIEERDENETFFAAQDDLGPDPIGIIEILMKRRRDRKEKERLPLLAAAAATSEAESLASEIKSASTVEESVPAIHEAPKPEKEKYISCKFVGPGPGQYEYYSTVGYYGHDPTRTRAPDFSFGRRLNIRQKRCGPGPKYNVRNFTNRGKDKPKGYTFGKKKPPPEIEVTPGPGHYNDQTSYIAKRSKGAILYGRPEEKKVTRTPVAIGELSFMGRTKPAACLLGKPKAPKPNKFPSPLSYAAVKPDVYMTKGPSFTMGYNRKPPRTDADFFPTIGSYNPNYDYFLKKRNIVIPSSNNSCVRIPLDLPEKKSKNSK